MSREEVSLSSLHKASYGPAVGLGFYTVWGIYREKSPITAFAGLGSGGEGGSWLWMMTGALTGTVGRVAQRQVMFPYTANGLDKPMVLPSFRTACHCHPQSSLTNTQKPIFCVALGNSQPSYNPPTFSARLPCCSSVSTTGSKKAGCQLPSWLLRYTTSLQDEKVLLRTHLPASDLPQSISSFLQSNPKLACAPQRAAAEAARSGRG